MIRWADNTSEYWTLLLLSVSGQFGAVAADRGAVGPGEGGQLGGGEGVLVHRYVLHAVPPPRPLAGKQFGFNIVCDGHIM